MGGSIGGLVDEVSGVGSMIVPVCMYVCRLREWYVDRLVECEIGG